MNTPARHRWCILWCLLNKRDPHRYHPEADKALNEYLSMKSASDNHDHPQSVLLLSTPGGGKTTLVSQFPCPFILDVDRNIAGPIRFLKDNNKPINFFYDTPTANDDGSAVPRDDQFQRALNQLQEAAKDPKIKTIVIDSLTSFVDLCLTEVMRQQGRARGNFDFKTKTSKTTDEPLQIQDWGAFFGLLKHIIFLFKGTNKIFVITGHIKTEKDSLDGILKQYVACPGQMSEVIASFFSEVWLLKREVKLIGTKKQEVRKVVTFPTGNNDSLGLKSAIGIKSGEELDVESIIERLNK